VIRIESAAHSESWRDVTRLIADADDDRLLQLIVDAFDWFLLEVGTIGMFVGT
jgi:hypothetical protein